MRLDELRARLREVLLETTGSNLSSRLVDSSTSGVTSLDDWINAAYDDLISQTVEQDPTYFMVSSDVTYPTDAYSLDLAGQGSPAMPSKPFRVMAIDDVTYADNELPIRARGFPERWVTDDDTHWMPMGSTKIRVWPKQGRALTLRVYWTQSPAKLTAASDVPELPPFLHWAIVYHAAVLLSEHVMDVTPFLAARDQYWNHKVVNYMAMRQSQEATRITGR